MIKGEKKKSAQARVAESKWTALKLWINQKRANTKRITWRNVSMCKRLMDEVQVQVMWREKREKKDKNKKYLRHHEQMIALYMYKITKLGNIFHHCLLIQPLMRMRSLQVPWGGFIYYFLCSFVETKRKYAKFGEDYRKSFTF